MPKMQINELIKCQAREFGRWRRTSLDPTDAKCRYCKLVNFVPKHRGDEGDMESHVTEETLEHYRHTDVRSRYECKRKLMIGTASYPGLILGYVPKITRSEKAKLFQHTERPRSARPACKRFVLERIVRTSDSIDHWFRKYAGPAAEGILSFCKTHNIVEELKNAVRLAEKCFRPSAIRLEEDTDPETGDRKILIALVVLNKPREAVLAAYHDFTQQSVKILPWPKRGFIRLSYDIS